jgi:antitoxin component YwqK of YwqJK toxin-antitoxin module
MKIILKILIFILPILGFSQSEKDKIIYLDSLYRPSNSVDYKYKKIIQNYTENQSEYKISIYNSSDTLIQQGFSLDKDKDKFTGEVVNYFSTTGKLAALTTYKQGSRFGKYELWYEDGNKKEEGEYIDNNFGQKPESKIIRFLDKNQRSIVLQGNGYYNSDTEYFHLEGNVTNGFKEGLWTGWGKKNFTFKEWYKNGMFQKGISVDSSGKKHKYSKLIEGGNNNLFFLSDKINRKLKFSEEAKRQKVQGIIEVKIFTSDKGKIIYVEIIKGLGYGLDVQVKEIFLKENKLKPSKFRGIPNKGIYLIPIKINAVP